MEIIIILAVLMFLFWIGYHFTGALLSAIFWITIKLPLACIIACLGLVCCITILLIPLGLKCFKAAGKLLF